MKVKLGIKDLGTFQEEEKVVINCRFSQVFVNSKVWENVKNNAQLLIIEKESFSAPAKKSLGKGRKNKMLIVKVDIFTLINFNI